MQNSVETDQTHYFVYIGSYGEGISAFRFDPKAGELEPLGIAGAIQNPSYLATDPDHRYLYAVSEVEGDVEGGVASFRLDRKTGDLHLLNTMPSGGVAPCHLTLDNTHRWLLAANYMSGSVSVFPIESGGRLGEATALATAEGSGVNPKRQEGPHAHYVLALDNSDRIYVVDLGLDRIRLYHLDAQRGSLSVNDPAYIKAEPGLGPRHFVFSHDRKFAYVMNELKPEVTVFSHDAASGRMTRLQSVRTLPEDYTQETTGAAIALDPAGRHLYTSNRGHDTIQVFDIKDAGAAIERTQIVPIEGKTPRGFAIDPSGRFLLVGGQGSNSLEIFQIDSSTGKLSATGKRVDVPSPVDVKFVPAAG